MNKFVFINQEQKKNQILVPEGFYREEDIIPGIYTTNSIRFYRNDMEQKLTFEFILSCNPNYTNKEIRYIQRKHHSAMDNFEIDGNFIRLKGTRTVQNGLYNFENGIIIVKNDNFIDVVERDNLQTYLDNYGFDIDQDVILQSDEIFILHI